MPSVGLPCVSSFAQHLHTVPLYWQGLIYTAGHGICIHNSIDHVLVLLQMLWWRPLSGCTTRGSSTEETTWLTGRPNCRRLFLIWRYAAACLHHLVCSLCGTTRPTPSKSVHCHAVSLRSIGWQHMRSDCLLSLHLGPAHLQ